MNQTIEAPRVGVPGLDSRQVRSARVLIAGVGNIGSALATQLARIGFKQLILVDRDRVERDNVATQEFFSGDIGHPKADVLATRLAAQFPEVAFESLVGDLEDISSGSFQADLLLGALDSRRARQLLTSEIGWPAGIPVVDGGVGEGLLGRVQVFFPSRTTACLECTWGRADYKALAAEYPCAAGGRAEAPPTAAPSFAGSIVAGFMAIEAIRILGGEVPESSYEIAFDFYHHRLLRSRLRRSPTCRFCHSNTN